MLKSEVLKLYVAAVCICVHATASCDHSGVVLVLIMHWHAVKLCHHAAVVVLQLGNYYSGESEYK